MSAQAVEQFCRHIRDALLRPLRSTDESKQEDASARRSADAEHPSEEVEAKISTGEAEDKLLGRRARATGKTLIFLSEGGTCRDPMAKAIATKLFEEHLLEPPVILALGMSQPYKPEAAHAARTVIREMYGEDLLTNHKPKQLTTKLAREADLILAMGETQLKRGNTRQPDGWPDAYKGKLYTLKAFFGLKDDIADPWPDGRDQVTLSRYLECANRLRQILSENFDQLIKALELV